MSNREISAGELLCRLGATRNYTGFPLMVTAITEVMEDESLLHRATTRLYPIVAARHGVAVPAMQRNFKTLIDVCWRTENRTLLMKVAGRPLVQRPRPVEFIDILAAYLLRMERRSSLPLR